MHADLAALAGGFVAMAAEDEAVALFVGGAEDRVGQFQRCAGGRILFEAVMDFVDFDVVVLAEKFCGFGGELEENKNGQRHVGGLKDGNVGGGLLNGGVIGILQSRRSDEHGDAAIAA